MHNDKHQNDNEQHQRTQQGLDAQWQRTTAKNTTRTRNPLEHAVHHVPAGHHAGHHPIGSHLRTHLIYWNTWYNLKNTHDILEHMVQSPTLESNSWNPQLWIQRMSFMRYTKNILTIFFTVNLTGTGAWAWILITFDFENTIDERIVAVLCQLQIFIMDGIGVQKRSEEQNWSTFGVLYSQSPSQPFPTILTK